MPHGRVAGHANLRPVGRSDDTAERATGQMTVDATGDPVGPRFTEARAHARR